MRHQCNYFQKFGLVCLGICLVLTSSKSFTLANSSDPGKLHTPLIRPGLTAEIRSLQFYGSNYYGSVEYHKRKPLYNRTFAAAKTKYINWELVLDHPISREETDKFLIAATLYDSSGKLVTKSETVAWIETDMTWSQWGGTFDVRAWKPGVYQVVITVGGRQSMKEYLRTSFAVVGEGDDFRNLQARGVSLRFFEGDAGTPDEAARVYLDRFPQATTRYIHWELKLAYPPPGKLVKFTINAVWYGPEGNILAHLPSQRTIQSDWDDSWHCGGYGASTPGTWRPGVYRLVLKANGQEVARGSFQVVAEQATAARQPGPNPLEKMGAKISAIKFFEGPNRIPADASRNFSLTFGQAGTRYIYVQVEFALTYLPNPPTKKFTQTTDILFFDSQGRLFKKIASETMEFGYTVNPFIIGYGWDSPGKWPTDTYQVVIEALGRELGRGSFRVE